MLYFFSMPVDKVCDCNADFQSIRCLAGNLLHVHIKPGRWDNASTQALVQAAKAALAYLYHRVHVLAQVVPEQLAQIGDP